MHLMVAPPTLHMKYMDEIPAVNQNMWRQFIEGQEPVAWKYRQEGPVERLRQHQNLHHAEVPSSSAIYPHVPLQSSIGRTEPRSARFGGHATNQDRISAILLSMGCAEGTV